jgi:hypothetical protein
MCMYVHTRTCCHPPHVFLAPGYDEPLSGGASYQQPSSHSPYDNDQFSSSDSYGSSGYDSGYGSGPEFGDSSMFDRWG